MEEICFNWMLKLPKKDLEKLVEGQRYTFQRESRKIYPTDTLVFLIDGDFNAKGVVEVEEFSITDKGTSGKYRIVYIPSKKEKTVLNKFFKNMYVRGDF